MSRFTRALRSRRDAARSTRAIEQAIVGANSPALRDELITIAQRNGGLYGR
jgi:hypothetical protein